MSRFEEIVFNVLTGRLNETKKALASHKFILPEPPAEHIQDIAHGPTKISVDKGYNVLKGHYRRKLGILLRSRKIPKRRLERESSALIRDYFTKAFRYGMLSQGARPGASRSFSLPETYLLWIARAANEEVGYLAKFWHDWNLVSDSQKTYRLGAYSRTLDAFFTAGKVAATTSGDLYGNYVYRWIINHRAEHCPGCVYLADVGTFTRENLPCTPRDGATKCLSNCKCSVEIEKVSQQEYYNVIKKSVPKRVHLQRLISLK